ncbi:MAG: long-chain fatty acid--CoA ligase, partial [Bacteroidetes bacterium SW_11_45_7]
FLPLCHIFERMVSFTYTMCGVSIYYAESIDTVADNLKEVQPHFFTTVPRLLEKVYERIVSKGNELSGIQHKLFFWALNLGLNYEVNNDQGLFYNLQLALANKLIFNKWREALGGNVIGIVTGAAACPAKLTKVFTAAGVPIKEGYGQTETSPVLTFNRFEEGGTKAGTVGKPIDKVEVKIAEDGEVIARGPNIMLGYYKNDEETKKTIDEDGWLHTGDMGKFDGEFLKITGRKKELFKTSGGKYVAPQMIENKMNYHLIKSEVDKYNQEFSHVEQIKKFTILPNEWTIDSKELTPTMKVRRGVVEQEYSSCIEAMY